jgi:type I restriction enzyme S subunit
MRLQTRSLISVIKEHGGLIQTGPFGSQLHQSDYTDDGIPTVMPKDIKDGRIDETSVARVSEQKAAQLSRHLLKPHSIVFPRRGDINKCAYIEASQAGFLCGTGCIKIEVPSTVLLPKFLYYYLGLSHVVEWLERNAVGTTMLNLSAAILGKLPVLELSIERQRSIVEILSAYDDLIENNRRRIKLLEQSARLLYKEWFVHLRFPGHEHVNIIDGVPDGWEKKPFSELATFLNGFAFKPSHLGDIGLPIVKIPELRDGPTEKTPRNPGDSIPEKYVLNNGDVLFSWSGTLLVNIWNHGRALLNQHLFKVVPITDNLRGFVFFALQQALGEFQNQTIGSTMKHIRRDALEKVATLVPDKPLLDEFDSYVTPILEQVGILQRQVTASLQARDLLLPRLMNGEVVV